MSRVLVTGGAGFIGSQVVDRLVSRGHSVAVVDDLSTGRIQQVNPKSRFFNFDIRNNTELSKVFSLFVPHVVYHAAAQMSVSHSVRDCVHDASVNVLGSVSVLEQSARIGVQRVVVASSGGVIYGDIPNHVVATEDHQPAPACPYGVSKLSVEKYCQYFADHNQLPVTVLRYANVYGPRQRSDGEAGVVSIFIKQMLHGEVATIHGDGTCVRDYVHVCDVVSATVAAIESECVRTSGRFTTFNIGTGVGTDVNTLSDLIRDQITKSRGFTPAVVRGPRRSGDVHRNVISPAKASRLLRWTPEVRLSDGIADTVRWFIEQELEALWT